MRRTPLKRTPFKKRKRKPKPGDDPARIAWVRTLMCMICRTQSTITEAAHVGDRGLGQKCQDAETIPLCAEHHRTGKDSAHVMGKRFWSHHGISREDAIRRYQGFYRAQGR